MADAQSKTFWSFLILVDVLLMVAFGWALADRVYTLLEEPVIAPVAAHLPKARSVARAEAAAQAQAAAAEQAKSALAAAPAAPAAAPPPAVASAAPAPAPAAPAAPKKEEDPKPTSDKAVKVVFSYHNEHAREVSFEASFTHWKSVDMDRHRGDWSYTVFLLPGLTYPYRLVVDGRRIADPANPVKRWGKSYRKVE